MFSMGNLKKNKKYEIRKFFFSISQIVRFFQKLPLNYLVFEKLIFLINIKDP
jgi:hypothetical protein